MWCGATCRLYKLDMLRGTAWGIRCVFGALNISSGRCCKALSSWSSQSGQLRAHRRLKQIRDQAIMPNTLSVIVRILHSPNLSQIRIKTYSVYLSLIILSRYSNIGGWKEKKLLHKPSPNQNFPLRLKINSSQLCVSISR